MLGNDVVIADAQVAEVDFQCLQKLGVKISTQKSLISDTGAFEFGKQANNEQTWLVKRHGKGSSSQKPHHEGCFSLYCTRLIEYPS